ncbi:DUF305 domain-containing protein [Aldersonia sp. NBC_00410]|uniref:DUF305 domain-containing protein n=1 Tax=Aldersonia sp. NBC_00410 TaxID=2975954 RepID=UPI00224D5540|nr:DUF305 domain-containing protein [Aldersonia sp. NBC_00410]MCX5043565.1 DUF305 domain-containing protein [Aldersonia sp. NBC_00410]
MTDSAPEPSAAVDGSPDVEHRPAKRSQRTALTVLGLVAAVAVGVALGFLLKLPLGDDTVTVPDSDSVDVGFAQDMTVHHSQAVEMATIAITQSQDPAVRNLAYDILTTQQNQIGQMQGWLALWDKPSLPSGEPMQWMAHDDGHQHEHGESATETESGNASGTPSGMAMPDAEMAGGASAKMPGMASSAEIASLRQNTGTAFDVQFLQLMLRHHQGGLTMMEYGADHGETSVVRDLANTMVKTQNSESELMTQMLAQRGAQPLPMN